MREASRACDASLTFVDTGQFEDFVSELSDSAYNPAARVIARFASTRTRWPRYSADA